MVSTQLSVKALLVSFRSRIAKGLSFCRSVASADRSLLLRRLLLLVCDALVLTLSFWASFALRLNSLAPAAFLESLALLPVLLLVGLGTLIISGWYRSLTRAAGSHSFYSLLPRTCLIVLLLLFVSTLDRALDPPRSFWFLLWSLMTAGLVLSRVLARDLLRVRLRWSSQQSIGTPTLIYGAGEAGFRLLQELRHDPGFHLVAVVDDSPRLWNRRLQRLPVVSPASIPELIQSSGVCQVLLALPSAPLTRRRELASELGGLGLRVLTIPSLAAVASGRHRVSELKALSIEDLLGREISEPLPGLLQLAASGKSVLITGAGGSIGSELCRQALKCGAKTLVLLERSEFALYAIHQELASLNAKTELVPVLADAADQPNLEHCCRQHSVEVLVHAAAYKHVPLVEANVCSALVNNIASTQAALRAARACMLQRFTLISTDKAVRPTNVMGASKRICELLVQNASAEITSEGRGPVCSMVRFGNVLGSSGSVVPLFRKQIASGGPVTVTHPQITRYFMTIPEAVQLVLQASAMAQGGEVFVLDMGEPVRIADLARQMIQLSGFSVRDQNNPRGDIALEFSGLRPGEKLFEELLISATDSATDHPLILQAKEGFLPATELQPLLARLLEAASHQQSSLALQLLKMIVPEYKLEQPLLVSNDSEGSKTDDSFVA
tara:strand:- start:266 stop:2272 length:2007 start_codon:yes stop_codon:yes gene_type:complete